MDDHDFLCAASEELPVTTIFDLCQPRDDVLTGTVTESDFAADLAQVIRGTAPKEYADPALFFAHTYPTQGLKSLLANVCARLSGSGGEVASIFRLDTSYGGGKTHGLIALTHAARGMAGVANLSEFIDPAIVPKGHVRIAAFDGENADPANGRNMGDGIRAFTPWGEIAYALAGKAGYERVRRSDETVAAPGAETIRELFGGEPTLILLDELSIYLRKVRDFAAREQLTAFLTSLFTAIDGAPNAALVYTLAIGKGGRANDAYSTENEFIAERMAEAESVSARKATLLNPTEEHETVQVLRRRLFQHIDEERAAEAVEAYRTLWMDHRKSLVPEAVHPDSVAMFRLSYPLHPEVLETLTSKTATLGNFQRVRGMLRLLARTIAHLWETRPADATAIHLHHLDLRYEPLRQEIITRLSQSAFLPALSNDVASTDVHRPAVAQEIDSEHYGGLPPYGSYVARTIFMHTLAFNEPLKGLTPDHLRYSLVGPMVDISFVEDARKRFIADSAYMDDRPGVPMRFLAEANLTQIIRRQEANVDLPEARAQLDDRIKQVFGGKIFELVPFPGAPFDLADEIGDGRPKLAIMHYDGVSVGGSVDNVPHLIARIYTRKGADSAGLRALRNNLVFVLADETRIGEMRQRMVRRLALQELKKPERISELAEHQQAKVRELEARSEQELAIAIQQCYRHIFYPSRDRVGQATVDLAHTAIDIHAASDQPGSGQTQIVRALRELKKLRLAEDAPDSPTYIRDRTPLRQGQITTLTLRDEFRKDPALPMLSGDDIFVRGIRNGVEASEYVYQRGDLLYGPGDPAAVVQIDEQSIVLTMAYATDHAVWPRTPTPPPPPPPPPPGPGGGPGTHEPAPDPLTKRFSSEAVLQQALTKVWEDARASGIQRLGRISIRLFDPYDGFRLMGAIDAISGVGKQINLTGGYATTESSEMELHFRGTVQDAGPLREFLEPQFRAASTRSLDTEFVLEFGEGLDLSGDGPEKLTERLVRYASSAAFAKVTALEKS
jgi:hypothetical protein